VIRAHREKRERRETSDVYRDIYQYPACKERVEQMKNLLLRLGDLEELCLSFLVARGWSFVRECQQLSHISQSFIILWYDLLPHNLRRLSCFFFFLFDSR